MTALSSRIFAERIDLLRVRAISGVVARNIISGLSVLLLAFVGVLRTASAEPLSPLRLVDCGPIQGSTQNCTFRRQQQRLHRAFQHPH